jgi:hypothetical protein
MLARNAIELFQHPGDERSRLIKEEDLSILTTICPLFKERKAR